MRTVDPTCLKPGSACAVVARSSGVAPEFLISENHANGLTAARWRRRTVSLDEPVRLTDHVLSYCMAGSATCSLTVTGIRHDHVQQAGMLTFLPADQHVQWTLDSRDEIVHVHLYLSKESVTALAGRDRDPAKQPPLQSFVGIRDAWLENFFRLLVSDYEAYGPRGQLEDSLFLDQTENLLIGRLLFVQAAANLRNADTDELRPRIRPLRPALVGRINEFVLHNLGRDIRLREMADIAGISVDYFVRAFRQATGLTPHSYVLELRLNHACGLLRGESTPVGRIARDCGFSCASRFSAAFRRRFGLAPTEYRRRH